MEEEVEKELLDWRLEVGEEKEKERGKMEVEVKDSREWWEKMRMRRRMKKDQWLQKRGPEKKGRMS